MAQIQEPPSAYAAQYPFNNVKQTESGHTQEFDDTPGAERIRTQHRIGTFVEWQPDGTEVHKIIGDGYTIVLKDKNVIIEGNCNINIAGNADITVEGDATTNIQGNVNQVIEKDYNMLVKGNYSLYSSGNMNFINGASVDNTFNVQSGRMVLDTDLTTHGKILADDVFSSGAITAGTGIHAGIPGSSNPVAGISTLGGINVGMPGPTVTGTVTATVSVTAPIVLGTTMVYGSILMDPEGGLPLVKTIYDAHNHIAPLGQTSPPLQQMP